MTPRYWYDSTQTAWVAPGRPSLPAAPDRSQLVYGQYEAGPLNSGLVRPDATFAQFEQTDLVNNYININPTWCEQQGIDFTSGVAKIKDCEFWGRVRPQRVAGPWSHVEYDFENCLFRGGDPAGITAQQGCIQNYGSNPPRFRLYDCKIDPSARPNYGTARGGWGNNWLGGIHGGNFELYRPEISHCQDGIGILGPTGSLEAAQNARHWIFGPYIHSNAYFGTPWTDPGAPSDQQPHCDGIQTSHGKNIKLIGGTIGGVRVPSDYAPWPIPAGRVRQGKDPWNACLMLRQANYNNPIYDIENVEIRLNIFGGGTASINHYYDASRPNAFRNTVVRDNRILRRGDDWGNLGPFGAGTSDDRGFYIVRSPQFASIYQNANNTIYETGQLAPVANGSSGA